MIAKADLHATGAYRYLPAIAAYSCGVAAEPGHEIVGLRLRGQVPVADAFARLDRYVEEHGLAHTALVGFELRSPAPFAFGAFDEFNAAYHALLVERGMLDGGANPVARTNVVPVAEGPDEPVLIAAFAVRTSTGAGGADFVVAGGGEVEDGRLDADAIVARGDESPAGMARKVAFVLHEMRARLAGLGHGPADPEVVDVYTAHDIRRLPETLAAGLPAVRRWGFTWWPARPPVEEIEFEMDLRRVSGWQAL